MRDRNYCFVFVAENKSTVLSFGLGFKFFGFSVLDEARLWCILSVGRL